MMLASFQMDFMMLTEDHRYWFDFEWDDKLDYGWLC